ncbi:hypothetical protein G7046_g1752 [Stylonectria norvegica]|nr:hypothetical protein G7046_g1752 [Stylonectria norvegica]
MSISSLANERGGLMKSNQSENREGQTRGRRGSARGQDDTLIKRHVVTISSLVGASSTSSTPTATRANDTICCPFPPAPDNVDVQAVTVPTAGPVAWEKDQVRVPWPAAEKVTRPLQLPVSDENSLVWYPEGATVLVLF